MRIKDLWRPLYDRGLTDAQIARRLGCAADYIAKLRREAGLPKGQTVRAAIFRALYDAGYCDRHIADECQCSSAYVGQWRRRCGLPPNREDHRPRSLPPCRDICDLCRWYSRPNGVKEYAVCEYYLRAGQRRGCPYPTPERNVCERFEPVEK